MFRSGKSLRLRVRVYAATHGAMFQMFAAAAASSSVSIPDVEPADALHAFRYAQGAHMTRLFDKLEGGLPVTVAAIGSSTTANGGAMFCSSPTVPAARGVGRSFLG